MAATGVASGWHSHLSRFRGRADFVGPPFFIPMALENWQRIDDKHSHCKHCGDAFRNVQLTRGVCDQCLPAVATASKRIVSNAENRTVSKATKASAQFMSAMQAQGKSGASMPKVFERFWQEIGGEGEFGRLMYLEFQKARGEGLSPDEMETWEPSPKLKLQWFELIARHISKNDEGKTLDIGALEESDLESILADLAEKALRTDASIRQTALLACIRDSKSFRRQAFRECLKEDPSLADEVLGEYGIRTVDGKVKSEKFLDDNKSIEDDDLEDWDPTEDEPTP